MNKTQVYLYAIATDKKQGALASVLKLLLFILSLFYGLAVEVLMLISRLRRRRLPCKVISVGNITLGGTGKTTTVEYIARYLSSKGRKAAVLSRGSGKKIPGSGVSQNLGDEPRMLAKKLEGIPVVTGSNRIRSALKAVADFGADTVIIDDGLQQWRIKKDLEIVTINSVSAFGNGYLLPRGLLRQGINVLSAADIFVLTNAGLYPDNANLKNILAKINPAALIVETEHRPVGFYDLGAPQQLLGPQAFSGRKALVFCGIGDPESFQNLLSGLGVKAGLFLRFDDHHQYTEADLRTIAASLKDKGLDLIITTEKDAARLTDMSVVISGVPVTALRVELGFIGDDENRFRNRLLTLYTL